MTNGKIILGISFILVGLTLLILSIFFWPVVFYGIVITGIGIALIIFQDSDQKIEQRKDKPLNKINYNK